MGGGTITMHDSGVNNRTIHIIKILKRIFLRTRHWSTPLGGLTRQLLKEGTTIDARIVNRDRSANPHFGTGALRASAPPGGDRLNCRYMSLLPLQQPEVSTRVDTG